MSPRIGPGGVSHGAPRGRGRSRLLLRLVFLLAMAAAVVWGGGGLFGRSGDGGGSGEDGHPKPPPATGSDGSSSADPRPRGPASSTAGAPGASGLPRCVEGELTAEAHDVIETITDGGEFEYPGKDGSTFGNREGLLPDESSGYYAEYTVPTPGEDDRGARRIVTGGDTTPTSPDTAPEHWYWTDDHYESFCEFSA